MRKRKFTHIDTRPWIVVDVNGKARSFFYTDEHGNKVNVYTFDGFRSANRAAKQFGGWARRA